MEYQDERLREKAAPKTINEEVGILLRFMGERGELIRARLKKGRQLKLKVRKYVAKVFSPEEKNHMIEAARAAKSPTIYPALMLATNTAMRSSEIRMLTWEQVDLEKRFLIVGRTKTDAGEGRTIFFNSPLYEALKEHSEWYTLMFGRIEPHWYLFPFGKLHQLDPTRPITTLKTAWAKRPSARGREWALARYAAYPHHGVSRKRCWRRDDHGHRWPRLAADAEALQPYSDAGQAGSPRNRFAKATGRSERQERNRLSAGVLATKPCCFPF